MRIFWINYSAIVWWKLSYWISCQQWHCSNLIRSAPLLECTVTDRTFSNWTAFDSTVKWKVSRDAHAKQQVALKEVAASRSIISVMFVLQVWLLPVWKLPDTNELGDLNSGVVIRQRHEKEDSQSLKTCLANYPAFQKCLLGCVKVIIVWKVYHHLSLNDFIVGKGKRERCYLFYCLHDVHSTKWTKVYLRGKNSSAKTPSAPNESNSGFPLLSLELRRSGNLIKLCIRTLCIVLRVIRVRKIVTMATETKYIFSSANNFTAGFSVHVLQGL